MHSFIEKILRDQEDFKRKNPNKVMLSLLDGKELQRYGIEPKEYIRAVQPECLVITTVAVNSGEAPDLPLGAVVFTRLFVGTNQNSINAIFKMFCEPKEIHEDIQDIEPTMFSYTKLNSDGSREILIGFWTGEGYESEQLNVPADKEWALFTT